MNTTNTFTKDINGWGNIVLKHKTKTVELEEAKTVKVHYITKEIDDGTTKDLKKVLASSTTKDDIETKFEVEKRNLNLKDYSFEEFKKTVEKFEGGEK